MENLFKTFLILHIVGGFIGLLTGFVNLVRKKGDKQHKAIGKLFFLAMLTTGFSSLVISTIHPNHFLFIVGIFTLYLVGTGNRYIYLKMHDNDAKPKPIDYMITYTMLFVGILFVGFGILNLIRSNSMGMALIVFGMIGLLLVKTDFTNYKGDSPIKNFWLTAHIQRMTAGFIAASTAFLVVNSKYFPEQIPSVVFWLLPTMLLSPLIFKWSQAYGLKK
jgi:uncharacterized membrane protein